MKEYARLTPVPLDQVRPFQVAIAPPYPDESLMGFMTRAFSRTVMNKTARALTLAGIAKTNPTAHPTTLTDPTEIEAIATLLKTTPEEIRKRTHLPCTFDHGATEAIDFFGVKIRYDYRDSLVRRVSPRALETALYHRAIWDLRVFSFDPDTKERLIDTCPECGHKLGWFRALGPHMCDRCVDEDGLARVDLRDYPQPLVEVEDVEALDFVTGLVDPRPDRRKQALRLAPPPWSDHSASDLFETAIAFACALTHPPDGPMTTLSRPKLITDYARFTPDVLAAAGRAIIGGKAGFTAVADRIRAAAERRRGHYGVKKELGPLYAMSVDQHLAPAIKTLVRDAVEEDMERTARQATIRRSDYAGDEQWQPAEALAEITGLPRKNLGWLAHSGYIPVRTSTDAKLSPRLMRLSDIAPLIVPFHDAMHQKFAAGTLAVQPEVLDELVDRKLIERLDGPVLGLFRTWAPYYRKSDVEALIAKIMTFAEKEGPPPPGGMPVSKAVKRLGVTPVPWAAVIAAIVSEKARVYVVPGYNKNWRTGVGAADIHEFVQAVLSETGEGSVTKDQWIGNQVVSEMLGANESLVLLLAKTSETDAEFRDAHGGVPRKGTDPLRQFQRSDVEAFAARYMFIPEIQRRAGITRARDVRAWLADRRVEVAFELEHQGGLGFRRVEVEAVLAPEERR